MKKQNDEETGRQADDVAAEHDLTGKPHMRGKYSKAYQPGHVVRIKELDGSTTVQYFTLEEGGVLLDPEVKAYFPDSESVNRALRSLIDLIPERRKPRAAGARKSSGRSICKHRGRAPLDQLECSYCINFRATTSQLPHQPLTR